MRKTLYILGLLFVSSCHESDETRYMYRDNVVRKYIAVIDSSGKYDTYDRSYLALKAYVNNDTSILKELDSFITKQTTNRENWDLWKGDIPLLPLKQLKTDEGYRFIYSVYGSPSYEVMTVYKKDTSSILHYLYYKHDRDSSKFNELLEFEKRVSNDKWAELTYKIRDADYWGLKNNIEHRGQDGTDLTVVGYQRSGDHERSHYVHRWGNTTLHDAFYYIYFRLLDKNERQF